MERPPGERRTKDVAREVCVRSPSKACIVGAISQSAVKYPITLKAFSCETNAIVASATQRPKTATRSYVSWVMRPRNYGVSSMSRCPPSKNNHSIYQLVTTFSQEALQAASLVEEAKLNRNTFMQRTALGETPQAVHPDRAWRNRLPARKHSDGGTEAVQREGKTWWMVSARLRASSAAASANLSPRSNSTTPRLTMLRHHHWIP